MYLCNTTFCVDDLVSDNFLKWIDSCFIPAIISENEFYEPLFTRIIAAQEPGSTNYALQFKSGTDTKAKDWFSAVAPELIEKLHSTTGKEKVLPFVTFMEIL